MVEKSDDPEKSATHLGKLEKEGEKYIRSADTALLKNVVRGLEALQRSIFVESPGFWIYLFHETAQQLQSLEYANPDSVRKLLAQ